MDFWQWFPILINVAALAVTLKVNLEVTRLRAHVYEKFLTKKDFHDYFQWRKYDAR